MGLAMQGWMRAGYFLGRLEAVEAVLGRARAAGVHRELGDAFRRARESPRGGMIPVADDVRLAEAIERVAGRSGLMAWSHDHAVSIARRGAFGAMVNNAIRLFGVTPHGMSRAATRAWLHVYRDMGRLVHVSSDPERIVLRWTDPPDWVAENGPYRATLEAGLSACLTLAQRRGEVRLAHSGGDLRFTMMCAPMAVAS